MRSKRTLKGDRLTELILDVFQFWGELERHGTRLAKPFGQTPSRWQVMGAVSEAPRTVAQIGRRMGLSRQGVQRVANALVRDRVAEFVSNPDHRRSPILRLTRHGEEILSRINTGQSTWSNEMAAGLNLQDLEAAIRTIKAVSKRFRDAAIPS